MDKSLSFMDLFQKSFIAMNSGIERFTAIDILVNLGMSLLLGMFIFFIYKKTFQGVLYQRSFNVSLVTISVVVTLIIMTISGNLILSLGMVGALSIVRFRTPIKDPVDLVFIFWAIAIGIGNGVGYFNLTIIGSIFLTIVLLFMTRKEDTDMPYLLVLQLPSGASEAEALDFIKGQVGRFALKSKTINPEYAEITAEVKLKNSNTGFVNGLQDKFDVRKATLVSYSGDLAQV